MSKRKKTNMLSQPLPNAAARQENMDRFRFFYDKVSPWLARGTVYGFEMHEEMAKPTILEHESAICALACATNRSIYGITSGRRGHFFYFNHSFYVADLGVLSKKPVSGGAVVLTHDDVLVGGWYGEGGGLFRHNGVREVGAGQEDFTARKDPIFPLPLPRKGDGLLTLAYDKAEKAIFGLTTSNQIISLSDGSQKAKVEAQGDAALAPALLRLPDGRLLGAYEQGQLWQYRPGGRRIEKLDVWAPCEKGKRYVAGVGSLVLSGNGAVYGGTTTDGFFFSYDPNLCRVTNLGKPSRQSFIKSLVEGHDGLIYGVVEEPQGLARLFRFDPVERSFEDLGIPYTFVPIQWSPHSIGAMCVGTNGEIFFGESDTLSHLFVYYPPVAKRRCADTDAASF